jgi:hypothetical protein
VTGTIDPPCGVPSHRMGQWEDVVLGIWWCPDCGEETWLTDGGEDADEDAGRASGGVRAGGSEGAAVLELRSGPADGGDAAGASGDRAPGDGFGWGDRPGGARLWHLIADAFGRAAE